MLTIGYSNFHVRPIGTFTTNIAYMGHNNKQPIHLKSGK